MILFKDVFYCCAVSNLFYHSPCVSELIAALVELKQRSGIAVGPVGGFVTPASVTPVIAAQGGGMGRSGRLLAAVMSFGLKEKDQELSMDHEAERQHEKGQLQHLHDLKTCDGATPEGRRRMQRVLTRMLNTQVRDITCAYDFFFRNSFRCSLFSLVFVLCRDCKTAALARVSAALNGLSPHLQVQAMMQLCARIRFYCVPT